MKTYVISLFMLMILVCNCQPSIKEPIQGQFFYFYMDISGFESETEDYLKKEFIGKQFSCDEVFRGDYINKALPHYEPADSIRFLDAASLPDRNFKDGLYKMEIQAEKDGRCIIASYLSEEAGTWRRIRHTSFEYKRTEGSNPPGEMVRQMAFTQMIL